MRKTFYTTTILLCSILVFTISTSCKQHSAKKEDNKSDSLKEVINEQEISSGENWLKSIFQCNNGTDYCFPDEEKVCTEQYYAFFIESLEIFEYPSFETEKEQIVAEKAFELKWKEIYSLDEDVLSPFGRGNGIESGQQLKNVSITSLSNIKYTVIVDYGDGVKTTTEVTLIANDNSFLIDYMKSKIIE